ncbi:DUF262 domain-containing protein [Microbacterium pygmaeum]|uniref:Uncharacterized conserved protein, contains ParB-like and HNH nuclease domains n=1 Tax=Microbacterium pygmaeum TaxID=370764 RepID=A0A1G7WEK2_9MICO|nr:DUF262 domain-containing protein [Microbacterium pygmaeum]SDG70403.1 Uncharacterized conserved protein, contains ParB-like and HNH nuclease domains [Microbacterium pygmaeum]
MSTATNIEATAVGTVSWLSAPETTIVVPVYQRQYRWDIGACEQLLTDIRAVSDSDGRHMHFIGSILSSASPSADSDELVLIDGQQRITTLMLLVAALHHTVRGDDPELAAELERVLVRADDPDRTKLRPHRAWASVFESVVLDRRADAGAVRESRFDDNYAFFRSQIGRDEAPRIWAGLQKLEHVSITLGAGANAQQIFESLNSTGEPLRDHELIHNYVLMGLTHAEQSEIEDAFWLPIEQNTGESIGSFWRHYLVMRTGREVAVAGERGVYAAFRSEFPRLDLEALRAQAAEWKEYSEIYRVLLQPAHAQAAEIARQLAYVNTFGRETYPLVMRAYRDVATGVAGEASLIETLEYLQSLLLRRTVVGVPTDRLIARLCRARAEGPASLEKAISRIMPSDERVRIALKYGELPHPSYVLGRIAGLDSLADVGVEHVFPLAPGDGWSGDGDREWADYTDDEQNSHRALAKTLGNLALLEDGLALRALDRSFPQKREVYARSDIAPTAALAGIGSWGTAAIGARTLELTERFLQVWQHPPRVLIDDDGLTPILDAQRRRGWPPGWQREFEYVEYRGEHWEVYDVRSLFNRIFKRLWAESRERVIAYNNRRGGPIYTAQAWNGQWDALDDTHFLYMGWDSKYMLTAVQGLLEEAGIAAEVFVKYSYIGNAMA